MKQGWSIKSFGDCIEKVKATTKLQSSLYKDSGTYPIVSQEKELISGYWDIKEDLFCHSTPLVVFGDHTMVVKYIDFDFVVGADGVKILMPKPFLLPKFFYYWVSSVQIQSRGYARHFRYLKETSVPIPSQSEQQRIVDILDAEFVKIDALKENAEKNLQNAKDLFQAVLRNELKCDKYYTLQEAYNIKTGKLNSNAAEEDGIYPFFTCSREVFAINSYAFDCEAILLAGNNASGDFNVKHYKGKFNAYQRTYVITAKESQTNIRVLYYILTDHLANFKKMSLGANTKFLKLGMIEGVRIPAFNEAQMRNVVARLDKLDEQCKTLEENYKRTIILCNDLKQALLRKAFNGEL